MALDHLNLSVSWPDKRQVRVDVLILPDFDTGSSAGFRFFKVDADLPSEEIGPAELESLGAFQQFLARLTRSAAAEEVRQASCERTRRERLLKVIGINGPPPDLIAIDLPANA